MKGTKKLLGREGTRAQAWLEKRGYRTQFRENNSRVMLKIAGRRKGCGIMVRGRGFALSLAERKTQNHQKLPAGTGNQEPARQKAGRKLSE